MKCVCYHISQVYFWRFHIWIWIGQYDWEHGSDVRHPAMDRIVCLSYHCQKAFLSLHSLYFVFLACVMNLFTFFRPVFRLLLFSSYGASVWPASYQPCTPQGLRLSLFQTRHWKYIQLVGELTNEPLKRGKHLSSNNQHNWEIWMELRAASHAFLIKKERHWRKVGGNSQLNHFHFCSVLTGQNWNLSRERWSIDYPWLRVAYSATLMLVQYIIPISVIAYTHTKIIKTLRKRTASAMTHPPIASSQGKFGNLGRIFIISWSFYSILQ